MLIDPKSNQVRGVAKLNKKDARSETGLFLLEGPQGLKEALARPKLIVDIYVTEEALNRHAELIEQAEAAHVDVQIVSESVLKVMCDTNTPQGVLAVCQQLDVSLDGLMASKPKLVALLAALTLTTQKLLGLPPVRFFTCRWSSAQTSPRPSQNYKPLAFKC